MKQLSHRLKVENHWGQTLESLKKQRCSLFRILLNNLWNLNLIHVRHFGHGLFLLRFVNLLKVLGSCLYIILKDFDKFQYLLLWLIRLLLEIDWELLILNLLRIDFLKLKEWVRGIVKLGRDLQDQACHLLFDELTRIMHKVEQHL